MWNAIAANKSFRGTPSGHRQHHATGPSGNIDSIGVGKYYNLTKQVRMDHNFTNRIKLWASYSDGQSTSAQDQRERYLRGHTTNQLITYTVQNAAPSS